MIEGGVLDPVGVVEVEGDAHQLLAEAARQVQSALDVGQDALEGDATFGGARLVVDGERADVRGSVLRLEVEEGRIHPAELFHGESPRFRVRDPGSAHPPNRQPPESRPLRATRLAWGRKPSPARVVHVDGVAGLGDQRALLEPVVTAFGWAREGVRGRVEAFQDVDADRNGPLDGFAADQGLGLDSEVLGILHAEVRQVHRGSSQLVQGLGERRQGLAPIEVRLRHPLVPARGSTCDLVEVGQVVRVDECARHKDPEPPGRDRRLPPVNPGGDQAACDEDVEEREDREDVPEAEGDVEPEADDARVDCNRDPEEAAGTADALRCGDGEPQEQEGCEGRLEQESER